MNSSVPKVLNTEVFVDHFWGLAAGMAHILQLCVTQCPTTLAVSPCSPV
jgi:hypothetical protein